MTQGAANYVGHRILEAMHEAVRYAEAIFQKVLDARPPGARTVLDSPNYSLHAARMADEFAAIDTRIEILRSFRIGHDPRPVGTPGNPAAGIAGQRLDRERGAMLQEQPATFPLAHHVYGHRILRSGKERLVGYLETLVSRVTIV